MNLHQIVNGHLKNTFSKNNLITLGIGLLLGVLLMYFIQKPTIVEVPVKVKIEVPVPVIEKQFDTIYKPQPYPVYVKGDIIKEIDSSYYNRWLSLKDSISKDKAYKDAITIREYNTKFEDDILTLNIYSKTRGTLLEIKPDYKTKPRTIPLDTTLMISIPKYNQFYGGIELGVPIIQMPFLKPSILGKANFIWQTKKDKLINISIDTEGRLYGGYSIKF
jgi:hypothetical protein